MLKRIWRRLPPMPDQVDPLCESRPMVPGISRFGRSDMESRTSSGVLKKPMQFPPQTAMPASRAMAPTRARKATPSSSGS